MASWRQRGTDCCDSDWATRQSKSYGGNKATDAAIRSFNSSMNDRKEKCESENDLLSGDSSVFYNSCSTFPSAIQHSACCCFQTQVQMWPLSDSQ